VWEKRESEVVFMVLEENIDYETSVNDRRVMWWALSIELDETYTLILTITNSMLLYLFSSNVMFTTEICFFFSSSDWLRFTKNLFCLMFAVDKQVVFH
jgi:hypothetical protein